MIPVATSVGHGHRQLALSAAPRAHALTPDVSGSLALFLLRLLASLMLGMAIYTLLSGGVSVISSIVAIAQAANLLSVAPSVSGLAAALAEEATRPRVECTCSRLGQLKALAVFGIVIAIIELIAGVSAMGIIGYVLVTPFCPTSYYPYYNYYYSRSSVGAWLLYATGNTGVSSALNLAWSVVTVRLIKMLRRVAAAASPRGPSPLVTATAFDDELFDENPRYTAGSSFRAPQSS